MVRNKHKNPNANPVASLETNGQWGEKEQHGNSEQGVYGLNGKGKGKGKSGRRGNHGKQVKVIMATEKENASNKGVGIADLECVFARGCYAEVATARKE